MTTSNPEDERPFITEWLADLKQEMETGATPEIRQAAADRYADVFRAPLEKRGEAPDNPKVTRQDVDRPALTYDAIGMMTPREVAAMQFGAATRDFEQRPSEVTRDALAEAAKNYIHVRANSQRSATDAVRAAASGAPGTTPVANRGVQGTFVHARTGRQ